MVAQIFWFGEYRREVEVVFILHEEKAMMSYSRQASKFLKSEGLDNPCRFMTTEQIEALTIRSTAHWHSLYTGRHIGIHRPDARLCNWTARILTKDKLYRQKCLGSALELGHGSID